MTTSAEALSSVTNQQQTAFDRERVVEPERQRPGVAETSPGEQAGSADGGQPVSDREATLERQLEQERQQRQQLEAELAHKREQARKRQQRYKQRHPEKVREQNAAYMRKARLRQREQGSSTAGRQQPAWDRFAEREGQLQRVQQAQIKPERQDLEAPDKQERRRAQNAAAKRRYRERRGDEGQRQEILYKREWRVRQRGQGSSADVQEQPVVDQVSELERLREEARHTQAKLARQRELKNARQQRWRQAHPEETRQRKREERARARRRQNPS